MTGELAAPLLDVRGLTKTFRGLRAVDAIDLALAPGSVHGLIGPNGAGKTTLFNLVSGVLEPDAGTIALAGASIDGIPTFRRTAFGLARTFQNIRLFPAGTALENVLTGMHDRLGSSLPSILLRLPAFRAEERRAREEAEALLDLVGLAGATRRRAGDLPYGDQRRLEIARALASRPKLLLLDEPAAGMNAVETASLMPLLRDLVSRREISLLLVEHDMKFVMSLCDRITVMNFGRKIAEGSPREVREHPDVVAAYLGAKHAGEAR